MQLARSDPVVVPDNDNDDEEEENSDRIVRPLLSLVARWGRKGSGPLYVFFFFFLKLSVESPRGGPASSLREEENEKQVFSSSSSSHFFCIENVEQEQDCVPVRIQAHS